VAEFEKIEADGCDGDAKCEKKVAELDSRLERVKIGVRVRKAEEKLAALKKKTAAVKPSKPSKVAKAAPAVDAEALEDRFDAIKSKIQSAPELRKDAAIQASLKRISGKFERLAGDEEEEAAPAVDAEALEDRFDAIKSKIQSAPELRKNAAIQASLKRISGKFERLSSDEEEDDEEDEEEEAPKEADLEARLKRVRSKIMGSPKLKKDASVMKGLSKVMDAFERAKAGESEEDEEDEEARALEDEGDEDEDLEVDAEKPAARASKAKGKRSHAMQPEAIEEEEEEAESDEDSEEESEEDQLERMAERFDAIKAKIEKDPALRKDKKVSSALGRIASKFERLEEDA